MGRHRQHTYSYEEVKNLYVNHNMTFVELGIYFKCNPTTIFGFMKRRGFCESRSVAKREQRGNKNSSWVGDKACSAGFHRRLKKIRGKANCCEVCNGESGSKNFDWANQSGNYNDINDYKMMCRSCHKKFDIARKKNGTLWNHRFAHLKQGKPIANSN